MVIHEVVYHCYKQESPRGDYERGWKKRRTAIGKSKEMADKSASEKGRDNDKLQIESVQRPWPHRVVIVINKEILVLDRSCLVFCL